MNIFFWIFIWPLERCIYLSHGCYNFRLWVGIYSSRHSLWTVTPNMAIFLYIYLTFWKGIKIWVVNYFTPTIHFYTFRTLVASIKPPHQKWLWFDFLERCRNKGIRRYYIFHALLIADFYTSRTFLTSFWPTPIIWLCLIYDMIFISISQLRVKTSLQYTQLLNSDL